MEHEAIKLRSNRYAVRPKGAVGTCGSIGGQLWQVRYVKASSPAEAIRKAFPQSVTSGSELLAVL